MKNMFDLTGRVAIVTGAAGGLGSSAVRAYLEYGAQVAALDVDEAGLAALADELQNDGHTILTCVCDVSDEGSVNGAVARVIETYGKVDILFNNAGIATGVEPDSPMEIWDKTMEINLRGQWLMIRAVLPGMVERKYGRIVNSSSINATVTFKYLPLHPYCASKAGVLGLTRSVAAYYGVHGITCNAVCPGLFITNMTRDTWSPEMKEGYNQTVPLGRAGGEDELNGTLIYLSSDASAYVTGAEIMVDGGGSVV
jgi:gluconate 5-dehydrogenase